MVANHTQSVFFDNTNSNGTFDTSINFTGVVQHANQTFNTSDDINNRVLSVKNISGPFVLTSTEVFVANILFNRIIKLIITVTGVIGNGIIIAILTKRKNRHSSTSMYLTALAISDLLILIFGPFSHWLITTWDINISRFGTFECKLYAFMQSTSVSISSWLLVAVTFERVICVVSPCHVKTYCTQKLAAIFIFVIWLVMYVADIHFFWGMGHRYGNHCEPLNEIYQTFLSYILPWVDFSTAFGLPALFLCIGNLVIIRQVTVNRLKRNQMTYSRGLDSSSITPILISATAVFIITLAPHYIISVCLPHWISDSNGEFLYYINHFWNPILQVVWESNSAWNFVLYFLSGSRFRLEVKAMFSCSCRKYSHRAGVFDLSYTTELLHRV